MADIENKIWLIEDKIIKLNESALSDKESFTLWKTQLQEKNKESQSRYVGCIYFLRNKAGVSCDKPPAYRLEDPDNIFLDLQRRNDLNREIEHKNAQILVYDEKSVILMKK